MRKIDCKAQVIGVMLRTKDFKVVYEKKVLHYPTSFEMEISDIAFDLLGKIYSPLTIYRSTAIILHDLHSNNEEQLFLFSDSALDSKKKQLTECFDKLESKFGKNIIQIGFFKEK